MLKLTPEEREKFLKASKIIEKGDLAVIFHIMHFDDTLEAEVQKNAELREELTGKVSEVEKTAKAAVEEARAILKGKDGVTPTNEELTSLFRKLFTQPKNGETPSDAKLISLIKKLIPDVQDGHTPSEEELIVLIDKRVPKIEDIENDLPKLGEPIRDALELLPGDDFEDDVEDERLDWTAIRGLQKRFQQLEDEIRKVRSGTMFVGGGSGGRIMRAYDLSASLDGVTKTFGLPAMWRVIAVMGTSSPFTFRENVDFTWTPESITFTNQIDAATVLSAGQTITILYAEN